MALALTVGALIGGGVFMMLRRGMVRLIIGFVLLSHGVNLLIMAAGGVDRRDEPLGASPDPATTADPLPQAFVLTAIVIAFAITMYMLVLAVTGDDDDDTDLELTGRETETPDLMDDPADDPAERSATHRDAPAGPGPAGGRGEQGRGDRP
ncbi:sodium:proton antiporter [Kocuria flava]|uniref:sodium:proton antiporter n=1 Tax=Kocuria flava TaxID=446860 RepID=UPI0027E2505E|nr:cation:proton antiporter subunit C [Kocuria flava]